MTQEYGYKQTLTDVFCIFLFSGRISFLCFIGKVRPEAVSIPFLDDISQIAICQEKIVIFFIKNDLFSQYRINEK